MSWIQTTFVEIAWVFNAIGVFLIIFTRVFSNNKRTWFGVGCLLLLLALSSASILLSAGLNPSQQMASLFGLVVLGSLGSRFVGIWLTDGAA